MAKTYPQSIKHWLKVWLWTNLHGKQNQPFLLLPKIVSWSSHYFHIGMNGIEICEFSLRWRLAPEIFLYNPALSDYRKAHQNTQTESDFDEIPF